MDRTRVFSQSTTWTPSVDGITVVQPLAQAFSTGVLPVTGNALHGLTNVGQGGGGVNPYHPDPRIKQFMFGFQYAVTPNDLLEVNYVGNRGTRIIVGSMNYGQLDPKYLSMGSALNNKVANPFAAALNALNLPTSSCGLSSPTISQAQLLEPYPEFCGGASASQEPVGFSNYNSLQATFTHRVSLGPDLYGLLHLREVPRRYRRSGTMGKHQQRRRQHPQLLRLEGGQIRRRNGCPAVSRFELRV